MKIEEGKLIIPVDSTFTKETLTKFLTDYFKTTNKELGEVIIQDCYIETIRERAQITKVQGGYNVILQLPKK